MTLAFTAFFIGALGAAAVAEQSASSSATTAQPDDHEVVIVARKPLVITACLPEVIATLPVTMQGIVPVVHAQLDGMDVKLALSTNLGFSSLTKSTVHRLNRRIESSEIPIHGLNGSSYAPTAEVPRVVLGSLPARDGRFVVVDGTAYDAAGVVGANWLGRMPAVEYDLANGVVRFLRPRPCGAGHLAYWAANGDYSVMDIRLENGPFPMPRGTTYLNGAPIDTAISLGGGLTYLSLQAAARAGLKPDRPGVEPVGWLGDLVPGVYTHIWIGSVASLKIGDEEIRNTELIFGNMRNADFEMLLGTDFFLTHRVLISNTERKIYFTHNDGPAFGLPAALMDPGAADAGPLAEPPPIPVD